MENEMRHYFKRLDPRNYKLTSKILLIVLILVALVFFSFFLIGLRTLHSSLLKVNTYRLEELCYIKDSEIETSLSLKGEQLLRITHGEELQTAATELINSFLLISDESSLITGSSTLDETSKSLNEYYSQILVPNAPLSGEKILFYFPSDEKTILAQSIYLSNNPKPYGEKDRLVRNSSDNSSYSSAHGTYHNYFLKLRDQLSATDIYIVDPRSGYVVYSIQKNIDFGSNLLDSKLKETKISEAFRKAMASDKAAAFFTDYSSYIPAGDKPVSFFSIPVYSSDQRCAVLIVQFSTHLFDDILTKDYMAADESSLEYSIVGRDLAIRNNPKDFLFNKETCLHRMMKKASRRELGLVLNYQKTDNMAMLAAYPKRYESLLLSEGSTQLMDYFDNTVLLYSKPIHIQGNEFFLQAKINKIEVLQPFTRKLGIFILTAFLLLLVVYYMTREFGRALTKRIRKLLDAMLLLHNGEKSKAIEKKAEDEVGDMIDAYNLLRRRINSAEEFAIEMSEGNYNYKFEILSERDSLGKSLNVLKDTLIQSRDEHEQRAREDEIRNWINTGVAKFNDLLRQNNTDINLLAYTIIENLSEYIGANVGGIFLIEGEKESEKYIALSASYAYDRRKYHQKRVEINEGLLGACYLEKKAIYLKEIPEDYIEITSGLGHQLPKCLYIVPLKVDNNVLGLMEIASNKVFENHHIEFIDQVSNSIAATFVSVRLNMKTATLLEESNRRAEEITQQEEEMRQNLEEMQATQEELARLRQDDEKHRREMQLIIDNTRLMLRNLVDAIPGGYILKDQNGIIHTVNTEGAEIYGLNVDQVLGKTDHELLGVKVFEAEHKIDLLVIEKGIQEYDEEREVKGEKRKYHVIKKPFNIKEIGQTGIFTIRYLLK
jgi:PAS domain S-box-containing protein